MDPPKPNLNPPVFKSSNIKGKTGNLKFEEIQNEFEVIHLTQTHSFGSCTQEKVLSYWNVQNLETFRERHVWNFEPQNRNLHGQWNVTKMETSLNIKRLM